RAQEYVASRTASSRTRQSQQLQQPQQRQRWQVKWRVEACDDLGMSEEDAGTHRRAALSPHAIGNLEQQSVHGMRGEKRPAIALQIECAVGREVRPCLGPRQIKSHSWPVFPAQHRGAMQRSHRAGRIAKLERRIRLAAGSNADPVAVALPCALQRADVAAVYQTGAAARAGELAKVTVHANGRERLQIRIERQRACDRSGGTQFERDRALRQRRDNVSRLPLRSWLRYVGDELRSSTQLRADTGAQRCRAGWKQRNELRDSSGSVAAAIG